MAGMTKYLQDAILNWLKSTAFPSDPAAVYVGLFTTAPADDNSAGTEVSTSGTAYIRKAVTLSAITGTNTSEVSNSGDVTYDEATGGGFGTVVAAGLFDAESAGNLLMWNTLTASKTIAAGDTAKFPTGSLVFTMA